LGGLSPEATRGTSPSLHRRRGVKEEEEGREGRRIERAKETKCTQRQDFCVCCLLFLLVCFDFSSEQTAAPPVLFLKVFSLLQRRHRPAALWLSGSPLLTLCKLSSSSPSSCCLLCPVRLLLLAGVTKSLSTHKERRMQGRVHSTTPRHVFRPMILTAPRLSLTLTPAAIQTNKSPSHCS